MIELDQEYFYNSEDGGQHNVIVTAVYSLYEDTEHFTLIIGKNLLAPCTINGKGLLVVPTHTLSPSPLASITRLDPPQSAQSEK